MRIPINDHLSLTRLLPTDREACIKHLADPAIAATTCGIPYPFCPDDFAQRLARDAATEAEFDHPLYLAIRQSNGWLIGMIAFEKVIGDGVLEIGYWLAKPWWKTGVMEASKQRDNRDTNLIEPQFTGDGM